jgi:hypothetical protein
VSYKVTTGDNCSWSVVTRDSAVSVNSPAGGRGAGAFTVTVATNATAVARGATFAAQDKAISIAQDGALAAAGNDESPAAFPMGSVPSVVIQDTSAGTESQTDPTHSCTGNTADKKTLWYTVVAPADGTLRLSFSNRRIDNGADSGTVMTAYRLTDGVPGAQSFCSVTPQSSTLITSRFVTMAVKQGDTFLVEISATTFNAPPGAVPMGGNLTLTAAMQ